MTKGASTNAQSYHVAGYYSPLCHPPRLPDRADLEDLQLGRAGHCGRPCRRVFVWEILLRRMTKRASTKAQHYNVAGYHSPLLSSYLLLDAAGRPLRMTANEQSSCRAGGLALDGLQEVGRHTLPLLSSSKSAPKGRRRGICNWGVQGFVGCQVADRSF